MEFTLFGPWSLEVTANEAGAPQRFVIKGSERDDGAYRVFIGLRIQSIQPHNSDLGWSIRLEWFDSVQNLWRDSEVREETSFDPILGLTRTFAADDNLPGLGDADFNDLIVSCVSLNPEHMPLGQMPTLPDFRIRETMLRQTGQINE